MTDNVERLSTGKLLAYASPALPIAAMGVPIAVYIPPFYAQEMGLGLAVVGIIFMIARVWDVITDPVLGVVSDHFPSRWGRRRHWLVLSVPIMLLSTWMICMPDPEMVTPVYLASWLFVMYVAWTLLSVTHMSWGAELTPDYHERSRVQGIREMGILIGAILVLVLPSVVEQYSSGNIAVVRMQSMGWLVITLLPITVLWAVLHIKENPQLVQGSISWKDSFTVLGSNRELQRILVCSLLVGVSTAITGGLFLFLANDVLALGSMSSIALLLNFVSGISLVPLTMYISRKIGKHVTLALVAVFYGLFMNVIWYLPPGSMLWTSLAMILLGVKMGSPAFLLRSMLADVIDEDYLKTGKKRSGLFYAIYSMSEKMGGALAIGFTYVVLDSIGYTPGAQNSADAITGFKIVYIIPTMVMALMIALLIFKFPITQARQEENRRMIDTRLQEQGAL